MKIEDGIRSKSFYAWGFTLAAGIALTATLIIHARPAEAGGIGRECPVGEVCPPLCTPSVVCGDVDPATVTGFFLKQKPNLVCVYQCSGLETCTERHEDCSESTFTIPHGFRRRVEHPLNMCPMDQAFADWVCVNGEADAGD